MIAALFLSFLFAAAAPAVHSENGAISATNASMTLMPERDAVYSGETFNVSVWIQADNVSTVQARIGFNESIFHATNVTLANTSLNMFLQPGTGINSTGIDNDKGIVGDIVGFATPPVNASDGLKIATITFEVIAPGGYTSPIHFIEANSEIDSYDVDYNNATMKANPVDVTIEPTHRLIGNTATTYNVNITPNGNQIRAMNFTPAYDPAYLDITDVTADGLFPIVTYNATKNVVLAFHPTSTFTTNGTAAIIHCTPLQSGMNTITLTDFTIVGNSTILPVNLEQPEATLEADIDPPNVTMEVGQPRMDPIDLTNNTYGIRAHLYESGAFTMYTAPGDLELLYPADTGHQTIRVDGINYSTMGNLSDYVTTPLTQTGPNTAYIEYMLPMNVWVRFDFQLIHNATKFTITTENQDDAAHQIGVKWYYDTQVAYNDGAPIYIPGQGVQTHEKTYYNPAFEYFSGYDRLVDPTLVSTGWISPSQGATTPDVVMLSYWPDSSGQEWWYETDPMFNFTSDSAVALFWNETTVAPSASRDIVTFYGIGEPLATGNYSIVDLYLDDPTGEYQAGETATISVDTVAAGQAFSGSLRLIVSNDGTEYFNQSAAVSMNAGGITTTTFDMTVPSLSDEYLDVTATLYNQTVPDIDSRTEENIMHVSSGAASAVTDIAPDKPTYTVNETATISVDAEATGQAFTGSVRLVVSHGGTEYLNDTAPVSINAGGANTTTFSLDIPDLPGQYLDAHATLYNDTGAVADTRIEDNLLFISSYQKTFYYVTSGTPLYVNATDAHNFTIDYRIWNGTWHAYNATDNVTFDLSGHAKEGQKTYYVEYTATDEFGNTAATGNQTLYLDDTPPTTTAAMDPMTPDGDNGWYVSDVIVNLTADDGDGSGVSRTYYYTGSQFPQPYDGNITIEADGTHTLTYYSTDNLGNTEADQQLTVNIDQTRPEVDLTATGTQNNGWYTSSVDITLEADDTTSGVAGIWYRVNDGDWTAYSEPFTLSTDGTHTIDYYAHDTAGNNASGSATIRIDTTKPSASISLSGPQSDGVYTGTVTISLSGTDTGSGVASLKYRVNGGSWSTYSGSSTSFTQIADGSYTVECYAVDTAGNQGSTTSRSFEILKNQKPTAAFSTSPDDPTDVDSISFDASASTDSDGSIVSYAWDFGDGDTGTGETASHTYDDNGTYTVTLTVTDDKGATDTATKQLTVANSPPDAVIQTDPTDKAKIDEEITFTSLSSDEGGELVNYTWNFGDGNMSYTEDATHSYDEADDYTVTLTVTDDDGATDTAQVTLTIEEEQPDYLLPILAIIVLVIIAIIVVLVWRRRSMGSE